MSLFVLFISLLIVAQHVSGNHVPIIRSWRLRNVIASCWYVPWLDALPTNRTWPPSCSHGTYQHKAITSHSRQLLMMGTWLPETCWATIRREIKNTKVTSSWFFLSTQSVVFGLVRCGFEYEAGGIRGYRHVGTVKMAFTYQRRCRITAQNKYPVFCCATKI